MSCTSRALNLPLCARRALGVHLMRMRTYFSFFRLRSYTPCPSISGHAVPRHAHAHNCHASCPSACVHVVDILQGNGGTHSDLYYVGPRAVVTVNNGSGSGISQAGSMYAIPHMG